MLLKELQHIKAKRPASDFNFDTEYDGVNGGAYGEIGCTVYYDATDNGYTDHPYGSTTAREYHGLDVEVVDVIADHEIEELDEDGKVIRTFPAGTSLYDLPGWESKDHDYFQGLAEDRAGEDISDAREQSEAEADDAAADDDDRYYY